ncbi:bolA-like protein 3 [Dermacentor variabilis]|uniref:bolA-like protein 3 n=1 Tax=Dermacentor variabilis TaxID=34621 RepID=UPI003F5CB5EF
MHARMKLRPRTFTMSRVFSSFVRRLQVFRHLSNEALKTSGEKSLSTILQKKFPEAEDIQVKDISGGCGAMYEVYVQSTVFKNLSRVQQHRLVNEALKAEIQDMHGIRITTALPGK